MINERQVERMFRHEFRDLMPNVIWQNADGIYEVFDRYRIQPESQGFRVFCSATDVGVFSTTRTALSWCIADKNCAYNTAQELLTTDRKLAALTADIDTRAAIGDRSRDPALREIIMTKLASKIIHKKMLENQLSKCVSWAKHVQSIGYLTENNKKK
jgi:hypothetical protein